MDSIAGESLQELFTTEKWQDLTGTLSETLGFTLSIYSENGVTLYTPPPNGSLCSRFRSVSPKISSQCDVSCHPDAKKWINSGKSDVFKCHARIMQFSLPIEYREEKALIIGQGSFENYDDFREFMNMMTAGGEEALSLSMPLAFTSHEQTVKVRTFVANSVSRLLRTSLETAALRRKFRDFKSMFGGWGIADGQQPDVLYREMVHRLSSLLDIECTAILVHDTQQEQYADRYMLSRRTGHNDCLGIREQDPIVQELLRGAPFVLSAEPISDPEADLLNGRGALYLFPLWVNGKLEAILRIEDRALDDDDMQIITGFCRQAALSMENYRLRHDLYKKFNRYAMLSELTQAITPIQNGKTLLQVIMDKSAELLKAEQGSLMVLDHEADVLLVQAKKGVDSGANDQVRIGRGEGIAGKVVELGEPFLVENLENDPRIKQKNRRHYKTPSFMSVPLKADGRVIGVINLSDKDGGEAFNEDDLKLIETFAAQVSVVMERNLFQNKAEELKKLIITDDLTGLLNRRYLYERLKDELSRSERYGHDMSLLMIDLDGFKHCNDTHGHLAGDRVLKDVSEILLSTVRSMDVVARCGGDEFMVILPETGMQTAMDIAERLRRNVSARTESGACPLTTSIGIACYPDHGKTSENLLENVDSALYRAKYKGKNSIEVFL